MPAGTPRSVPVVYFLCTVLPPHPLEFAKDERLRQKHDTMQKTPRHILILGLGSSGLAATELALRFGHRVTVLDEADGDTLRDRAALLADRGVKVHLEWNEPRPPAPVSKVVISPGIRPEGALGRLARTAGVPVVSEIEFAFRFCACPLMAVTGANGKTTTVEMTVHALQAAGRRASAAGNIGTPLSQVVLRSAQLDWIVVEVSSFQLEHVENFTPVAAALLNASPDHLDRHADFAEYLALKLRLFRRMAPDQSVVFHEKVLDLPEVCAEIARRGWKPVVTGRSPKPDSHYALDFYCDESWAVYRRSEAGPLALDADFSALAARGLHNVDNALAALALCEAAGADIRQCAAALSTFAPGRHRMELVAVENGICYINDSKSTNPDSLRSALETLESRGAAGRVLLIAGGLNKNLDFAGLRPLVARVAREVFLIGNCRYQLAKQWVDVVSCKQFTSLDAAVESAVEAARPGDTVILSPGCSSQDMFRNYAERGDRFCELVTRRTGE